MTVKWRPKPAFSFERLKGLFSYGWKLLASSLLDTLYKNLRTLIIGKKYSEADLAFYNRGELFPQLIVSNINSSVDSVLLPTLSAEQNNPRTRARHDAPRDKRQFLHNVADDGGPVRLRGTAPCGCC